MYNVFFFGKGKQNCGSVWTPDMNDATRVATALKSYGWMVVVSGHGSQEVHVLPQYEDAMKELQRRRDEE